MKVCTYGKLSTHDDLPSTTAAGHGQDQSSQMKLETSTVSCLKILKYSPKYVSSLFNATGIWLKDTLFQEKMPTGTHICSHRY